MQNTTRMVTDIKLNRFNNGHFYSPTAQANLQLSVLSQRDEPNTPWLGPHQNMRTGEKFAHHSYMDREYDQYNKSPSNYNYTYPWPPHNEGFLRELVGPKRVVEQNEAPEGGGEPGKRKQT